MAKVCCRDCRLLEEHPDRYRCLFYMKYVNPDRPRWCRRFKDKRIVTLPSAEPIKLSPTEHTWPP